MRSPPPRNPPGKAMGNISPVRGGTGFGPGPRGIGQQPWGGLPDSRGAASSDARGGGAQPQARYRERGGSGDAGSGDGGSGSRHQDKGERGGGLMSFIFGGGQQEKQRRQTPQMVKLPQVRVVGIVSRYPEACFALYPRKYT